ncbi:hypothetical protein FSP39_005238 [Pinctada imbricata]|uniref:C2 domain-containing protein n=1 Tax=Pinctada imbricata TaxID=66713 RepID=A0AA89BPX5_PINIB|nr:hypothetical protein FSP39_005238 [Pinctada imbricata]
MYADLIHKRLIQKGYYDEVGQFDITEQLCITINNIEKVRCSLKQLPDTLRYVDVQHTIESSNGSTHGHMFNLHSTLKAADEIMVSKIKQVVDRVADKQTFKGTEYGVLNLRMCCRHDSQTMIVEGFSDPYVVIQFCTEHIFPHVPIQETAKQKKTLNPTFDESFEL